MVLVNTSQSEPIDEKQLYYDSIKRAIKHYYIAVEKGHQNLMSKIWEHPKYITPQEIFDSLGTDAVTLLQISQTLQTVLAMANPDYVHMPAPYVLTPNEDGTITVGDPVE